jgi:hypothetical protein
MILLPLVGALESSAALASVSAAYVPNAARIVFTLGF